MNGNARRLSRLEERARQRRSTDGALLAVVMPESWSPTDRAAYDDASARDDLAGLCGVIERATGTRVVADCTRTRIISIVARPDGPQ